MNVLSPPVHTILTRSLLRAGREPGIPAREGGRSNNERQRLQPPCISPLEQPLLRSGEWGLQHKPLLVYIRYNVHELFYLICVILMFCFLT